jgi:hypothetical protein
VALAAEVLDTTLEEKICGGGSNKKSDRDRTKSGNERSSNSNVLCAAKDETSVDIMGRKLCCNFLRKVDYDKSGCEAIDARCGDCGLRGN